MFYNDLLEGLLDRHVDPKTAPAAFAQNATRLSALADHPTFGYAFDTLSKLCEVLALKCDLGLALRRAYADSNKTELNELAERIDQVVKLTEDFLDTFRNQWYRENKTFGFSCHEQRIGGLLARMKEASHRVRAYVGGEIDRIEELEQPLLSFDGSDPDAARSPYIHLVSWRKNVAAGIV